MIQTDTGVSLTARVGSNGSATVAGAQADTDALLQKLAEQVYRITQPFRYGGWARQHGHFAEALASDRELATTGPDSERPWGYEGWGVDVQRYQSEYAGLALMRRGQALDPNNFLIVDNIAAAEYELGRAEESQRDFGVGQAVGQAHGRDYSVPDLLEGQQNFVRAMLLLYQGDLLKAGEEIRKDIRLEFATLIPSHVVLALALAAMHEPDAARTTLTENPDSDLNQRDGLQARLTVELEAQDWPGVLTAEVARSDFLVQYPGYADSRLPLLNPLVALALAHMERYAAAEARLKPTPADCYPCLRARAQVAEMQKQDARADFWFARATAVGPSLPYAESEWGRALLDRGQPDAAIEKFKLANQKGPHFADPLEGWSEALLGKNQSHLALAKFAEANKYAPNWGRLHLKWGEALFYAGRRDEAAKQFARAGQLDLTPSEKAELARHP